MAEQEREILDFLNRMSVCVLAGDWRGFSSLVRQDLVVIGDRRTTSFRMDGEYERAFANLALRAQTAGWDGVRIELDAVEGLGRDSLCVSFRSTPMIGDASTGLTRSEVMVINRAGPDPLASALINPSSEAYWAPQSRDASEAGSVEAEAPGAVAAVHGLQAALQTADLPGWLASTAQPFVILYDDGLTLMEDAATAGRVLAAYRQLNERIGVYRSEPLELRRIGRSLMAGRFRIRATARNGAELDPLTNFYVLRRDSTGWRAALSFNAAIGVTLPPPPPLGRKDS